MGHRNSSSVEPGQPERFPHLFSPLRIGQRDDPQSDRLVRPRHRDGRRRLGHRPADRLPGGPGRRRGRAHRRPGRRGPRERPVHLARPDGRPRTTASPAIAGWPRPSTATGAPIVGQIFHDGRELMESMDGTLPVALAPSAVPNERFHVMPRAMPIAAHRGDLGRLRVGRPRLSRGRARRRGGRRQPRLPAGAVPQPARQPADGPLRRPAGEPAAVPARDDRRNPARRSAASRSSGCGSRSTRNPAAEGLTAGRGPAGARRARRGRADRLRLASSPAPRRRSAGSDHIVPPMTVPERLHRAAGRAGQGGRLGPGHGRRADQPAAGGRARPRARPGRRLRHDPGPDLRPAAADQGGRGRTDEIRACIGCNQACIGHFHAATRSRASSTRRAAASSSYGIRRVRRAGSRTSWWSAAARAGSRPRPSRPSAATG